MRKDDEKRMRELFLGYEELDAETRREVDAYLARHAGAREQLEALRELEARAREPVPMIELDDVDAGALDGDARAGERQSHGALRQRLGLPAASGRPRPLRRGFSPRWVVRAWIPAAAAVVLLLLLWPWKGTDETLVTQLHVSLIEPAGSTRSADLRGSLRTGDEFALTFQLASSAVVLVYHVDPEGQVELVVPASAEVRPPHYDAGFVRIPGAQDPERWLLGGAPGQETFLVAVLGAGSPPLSDLDGSLRREITDLPDRSQVVERLRSFLEPRMDEIHVVEIDHLP